MDQKNNKNALKGCGACAVIFILFLFAIAALGNSPTSTTTDQTQTEEDNAAARARFDEILAISPELDSIDCLNGDCTSVVYFNFNQTPEEGFDTRIRLNTATFSNWTLENIGTSHVTIFAILNGVQVMKCNGSNGAVDSCF